MGGMKTVQAVFGSSNLLDGIQWTQNANGSLTLHGLPVFREGTFKDSMGMQATWEGVHLEQMVFHYGMLRDNGILPNVPVRDGHRSFLSSGGTVIGWHTGLRHEGGQLLADFEITEPEAVGKIKRGTYRARSSEIGMYETNDEATFWPVYMGFAFVDIPAVEGLYNKQEGDEKFIVLMESEKESSVADDKTKNHSGGDAGGSGTGSTPTPAPAPAPAPTPAPAPAPAPSPAPAPAPAPQADHAAPTPGAFSFTVNGQPTTDFGAVQRHITALETAADEARDQGRKDFVTALATANKITQPQVASLTKVALGLDDDGFAEFRAAYDAAPDHPTLAVHAGPGTETPGSQGATGDAADEITVLRETVAQHRRAGTPEAQLEKMPSFIRLKALEAATPKE